MTLMRAIPTRLAVLLCAALAFTAACARRDSSHTIAASREERPTVAVAKAATEDLSHGIVLTAEFKPFQEVDVMAKVAGYVKEIKVDVGDRVTQGQLLATLEVPEMDDDLSKRRCRASCAPRPKSSAPATSCAAPNPRTRSPTCPSSASRASTPGSPG